MPRRKSKKKSNSKTNKEEQGIITNNEETKLSEINVSTENDEKLISDNKNLNDSEIKGKILELENENAELKATIEKAKKKLRIYVKKLDLTEEREEQWRIACYNIAGIFAEKTQVSLDDILKQFEAPIEDNLAF